MWRIIPNLELSGNLQMAIDLWLFKQHINGNHPPSLRFYTWSKPTISLGYHQKIYPDFWSNIYWQGEKIDLVRRPTGGRAVLHDQDLTYAVISSGFSEKRSEAYQQICQFLIAGWQKLGINLHYGNAGRGYIHNPSCFSTATGADLVTENGYKFIGSAQLRQGKNILQHGSMRIHPNWQLFTEVFSMDSEPINQTKPVEQRQQLLPVDLLKPPIINNDFSTIIKTLIATASDFFNFERDLQMQPFTQQEWQEIYSLAESETIFKMDK